MNGLCTLLLALAMTGPQPAKPVEQKIRAPEQRTSQHIVAKQLPQYTIAKSQNEDYQYLVYEIPKEEPKTYDI